MQKQSMVLREIKYSESDRIRFESKIHKNLYITNKNVTTPCWIWKALKFNVKTELIRRIKTGKSWSNI